MSGTPHGGISKKLFFALIFLSCGFGPFSCHHEAAWRNHTFVKREVAKAPNGVMLPRELWAKIEKLGGGPDSPGSAASAGGEGGKESAKEGSKDIVTVFAPLKIYLVEKNAGILQGGPTEIDFGPGGGEIDLRDFIEPRQGSFYFVADFLGDQAQTAKHIFYLSNGVERKIGGESVGAGCDTFFDVSSAFDKALKGTGFLVNTTEGRHVSALAGSYFFAAFEDGKLYLASLTIKDSSRYSLQCRR